MEKSKKDTSNFVFERSSGYAGYRCLNCMTWVYNDQPLICNCNKHLHKKTVMKASEKIETAMNSLVRKEIPKAIKAQQKRVLKLAIAEGMSSKYLNPRQLALHVGKHGFYLNSEADLLMKVSKISLTTPFVQMSNLDYRHGLDNLTSDNRGTIKLLKFLEGLNKKNIHNYFLTLMVF